MNNMIISIFKMFHANNIAGASKQHKSIIYGTIALFICVWLPMTVINIAKIIAMDAQ